AAAGEGGEKKEGEEQEEEGEEPGNRIYFEVKPEQCETLMEIIRGQDPANIALIVAHLRGETKKRFMTLLPSSMHGEVLFHTGGIRFIEPDVVATVKEELERRLESAVGGHRSLLEMIDQADVKSKRELLKLLEERDPELARVARSRILLFEDMQFLDMRDWSVVLGAIQLEDWATALYHSDDVMRDTVRSQMLPKTWAIIEQMMKTVRPVETIGDESQERIVNSVMKLIEEGRVVNPGMHRQAIIEAEAESKQDEAPPPLEEDAVGAG
ncbi:FliG C-terminal domain-containing protein, partial [Elusimicrobiota bacterium]